MPKVINHFILKMRLRSKLASCHVDCANGAKIMPQFYKLMLQFFHELKFSYESDLGHDLVLFNNKDILIDNKTFFYKSWFKKGIFRVHDLLTERGTFFSHGEFTKRYNLNCHFLQYLQVVSAIPKRLLEKAKQKLDPKFTFSHDDTFFQLSSTIKDNLLKLKSKDYYWLFINKVNPELKTPKKWARDLQFNGIELSCYFKNLKSICKENNLRVFYFKFFQRIIVTRKELCLYGIECNSACVYCQEPDSISHTFIHCRWSKEFFFEVIKWFIKHNGTSFSLSTTELLFGKLPNEFNPSLPPLMLKKLNYVFLFAKYYIYTNKVNSKDLSLEEFIKKLEIKYCIEGL